MDLVLNHVAREHEWATKARADGPESSRYRDYFHVFTDEAVLDAYEQTLPEVFPDFAPGNFTWDDDLQAWVWTTFNEFQWDLNWANPSVLLEFAEIILGLANLGVEVLRLDAIAFLWKRLGTNCQNQPEVHAITQALRAVTRIAAPAVAFKAEAIVGPRDLVQYLGTGSHAGRVSDLAYHNSLMVQVWSMLAARNTVLARQALGALPASAAHRHLDHLRPLPRRHRLGDRRPGRLRRRRHRPRAPGVPVRLVLRRVPGHAGPTGWSSRPTRRRETAGSAGPRRRCVGLASGAQSGPAVDNALARLFLAHAVVAGWGGIPVVWSGDELAQVNDPDWAGEPGPRGRQPVGAPAAARLVARGRPRRPAHRPGPGVQRASSTSRRSAPGCPSCTPRPTPRSSRTPTTACSPWCAGTPAAPSSASTTSPSRPAPSSCTGSRTPG